MLCYVISVITSLWAIHFSLSLNITLRVFLALCIFCASAHASHPVILSLCSKKACTLALNSHARLEGSGGSVTSYRQTVLTGSQKLCHHLRTPYWLVPQL